MARLNDKDWLKIKVQFESTDSDDTSLEAIAKEFGCSKGAISQKAKKDGWIRAKNKQTKQDNVLLLNNLIDTTIQTKQIIPETEQALFQDEIIASSKLKILASSVQGNLLNLVAKATQQAQQILENNPSGLHVKSQTDNGVAYGRNTEFIKDLLPAMNATNAILGIGKEQPTTAIQINNDISLEKQAKITYKQIKDFIDE